MTKTKPTHKRSTLTAKRFAKRKPVPDPAPAPALPLVRYAVSVVFYDPVEGTILHRLDSVRAINEYAAQQRSVADVCEQRGNVRLLSAHALAMP